MLPLESTSWITTFAIPEPLLSVAYSVTLRGSLAFGRIKLPVGAVSSTLTW